jgi:hypothetical protein
VGTFVIELRIAERRLRDGIEEAWYIRDRGPSELAGQKAPALTGQSLCAKTWPSAEAARAELPHWATVLAGKPLGIAELVLDNTDDPLVAEFSHIYGAAAGRLLAVEAVDLAAAKHGISLGEAMRRVTYTRRSITLDDEVRR